MISTMMAQFSRRDVLKSAAGAAAGLAIASWSRADEPATPIRLGFIGVGERGTTLLREVLRHEDVEIPAVCDIDEKNLNRALDIIEKARGKRPEGYLKGPDDYRRLLARDDLSAVLIATPQELHAAMATDAMHAGKFVGSEVPACCTVEECWQLVRTQRQTKTGYMMLENYLYPGFIMQVQNMAEKGAFGELTYGAGSYIHEIRTMKFNADGSALTWRGENVRDNIGVIYPTHAIGPVCRWMGVNTPTDHGVNGGGPDKLVSLVAMASKSAATHAYAVEKFGEKSVAAQVDFKNGDTNHALIRTAKGRLIEVRYDTASPRPAGMGQYSLQGTKGAYESALGERKIYLEGKSPADQWEPLEQYEKEFQHPRWAKDGALATKTGHNGGDYFVIADFLDAIRTGKSPIDVIDAVTWSVIRPLSADSILVGSKPVTIPDFSAT
jgi:predicted dehydrogenase